MELDIQGSELFGLLDCFGLGSWHAVKYHF